MTKEKIQSGHTLIEDIISISIAVIMFTIGALIFKESQLIASGTTGLSLILTYKTNIGFGTWFSIVNAPFFILAFMRMGLKFTILTIFSIISVSLLVDYSPLVIEIKSYNKFVSAIVGGITIGLGMLIMFRHRSSMGALSILGMYLQDIKIIKAGKFMLSIDMAIMIISFYLFDIETVLASTLTLVISNGILIMNHKEGRYSPNKTK
ncbi:MAG: YitT family protein [Alphaproteobacteria bacterium]